MWSFAGWGGVVCIGNGARHEVVIVLFDGMQSLDATGPLEVFAGVVEVGGGGSG